MKARELRAKAPAELAKLAGELENELFRLTLRKNAGQLAQPTRIRDLRKDLARLRTVERERVLQQEWN